MSAKKCDNMVSIPSNDMIVITYGFMSVLLSYLMMIITFVGMFHLDFDDGLRLCSDDGMAKAMKCS